MKMWTTLHERARGSTTRTPPVVEALRVGFFVIGVLTTIIGCSRELPTSSQDRYAPSIVTDLELVSVSDEQARLALTAPGGDGQAGRATAYDVRYVASSYSGDFSWQDAESAHVQHVPAAPGVRDTLLVDRLPPGRPMVFGMRAVDDYGNMSALSNLVSTATTSGLVLTAPVDGAVLCWGEPLTIFWSSPSWLSEAAKIELRNSWGDWIVLADSVDNTGQFTCEVTLTPVPDARYQVRVTDLGSGISTANAGYFNWTAERYLRVWDDSRLCSGEGRTIRWASSPCCGDSVMIELMSDGALVEVITAATENDGDFYWPIPYLEAGQGACSFRITEIAENPISDMNMPMRILEPCRISIIEPAESDTLSTGRDYQVRWLAAACCSSEYTIELLCNGTVCSVLTSGWTPQYFGDLDDVSWPWIDAFPCGNDGEYTLRVTENVEGLTATSAVFRFAAHCEVDLTAPGAAATYREGEDVILQWDAADACSPELTMVLIDSDGGERVIVEDVPNDGEHSWVVSGCVPGIREYRIKLRDAVHGDLAQTPALTIVSSPLFVAADGSGDYPAIGPAIQAAGDDFVIELGDGVYKGAQNTSLLAQGKNVMIRSRTNDPRACVIDGEGDESSFITFSQCHGESGLQGLTVRNFSWSGDWQASVVRCLVSNVLIRNCRFEGIVGDVSTGAAILAGGSAVGVYECVFSDLSFSGYVHAGALLIQRDSTLDLGACTFADIVSDVGACLYLDQSAATMAGCIISRNSGSVFAVDSESSIEINCSNMFANSQGDWVGSVASQQGLNGNISEDPLFCDVVGGDYSLSPASPCLPANNNCGLLMGAIGERCR